MSSTTAGEQFLEDFVNYEAKGVPDRAGTDTDDGFDLVSLHLLTLIGTSYF